MFFWSLWYLVPLSMASSVVVLWVGRKTSWFVLDLIWPLLPGLLWFALVDEEPRGRSLSNFIELPVLGVVIALTFAVRVALGRGMSRAPASAAMFPLSLALTWCFYRLFPGLPE